MTLNFKTYERKHAVVCGDCSHRLPHSGFCLKEMAVVLKTDPACKLFLKTTSGRGGKKNAVHHGNQSG